MDNNHGKCEALAALRKRGAAGAYTLFGAILLWPVGIIAVSLEQPWRGILLTVIILMLAITGTISYALLLARCPTCGDPFYYDTYMRANPFTNHCMRCNWPTRQSAENEVDR